ncbi:MAG: hypothetical protein WBB28_06675 [Crinalium sp.]
MTEETQRGNENQPDSPDENIAPEELPRQIFRQEAIDYLSSPEQLDRPIRLLRTMDWLTLTGFGTMAILSLLWGIFGKIPITVSGRGVLVRPAVMTKTATLKAVTFLDMLDGQRVKPGMKIQITPDIVKRERFGSIVGKIIYVSPFPVSKESASEVVGNPEIAQNIMGQDGEKIEVIAQLQTDGNTPSGLKWSASTGPDLHLIAGTTTMATITVEEPPPLSFVLPFIYEWKKN